MVFLWWVEYRKSLSLDTGAGQLLIYAFSGLQSSIKIVPIMLSHSSISGQRLEGFGPCESTIKVNKTTMQYVFTVVSNIPHSVLMGSDFMVKYKAVIDYGKNWLKFWHNSVPL